MVEVTIENFARNDVNGHLYHSDGSVSNFLPKNSTDVSSFDLDLISEYFGVRTILS